MQQTKQSNGVGLALHRDKGGGRAGEGGGSKAENRQQADKQKAAQRHTPRPPACFDLDEPTDGVDGDLKREEILPSVESHSFRRRVVRRRFANPLSLERGVFIGVLATRASAGVC